MNQLLNDPSQTSWLRRQFSKDIKDRLTIIGRDVITYLRSDSAYASLFNAEFTFGDSTNRLKAFKRWMATQMQDKFTTDPKDTEDDWWMKYIVQAFNKGTSKAYDQTRKRNMAKDKGAFDATKKGFMQGIRYNSQLIEQVKLLGGRTYTDLEGVSSKTQNELARILSEGLIQGKSYKFIGARINEKIKKISKVDGERIARTEIVRAQAEGQLNAYELIGVGEIGIQVEFTNGRNPCPICKRFEGAILKPSKAHGIIPVHPNCSCAFLPIEVTTPTKQQKAATNRLKQAVKKSLMRSR